MATMQCCVIAVNALSGTGTQSFDGVVRDASSGALFTPTFFLIQGGYAAANTVTSGVFPLNYASDMTGADTGVVRAANFQADTQPPLPTVKITSHAQSLGDYSILDYTAGAAFGGTIHRKAKIVNIRSGGFDIQYDQNDRTGDVLLLVCFGGDGLAVQNVSNAGGGVRDDTYTSPETPHGLLIWGNMPRLSAGGATATAVASALNQFFGWDSRESAVRGSISSLLLNFATGTTFNYGGQRTDCFAATLTTAGAWNAARPIVSDWAADGFTISGVGTSLNAQFGAMFCGADILTAAGTVTQPLTTGAQVFSTGINAKWIIFASGGPSDSSITTPAYQTVRGWSDGVNQGGYWGSESAGGSGPYVGARYLSTNRVLQWGTANGTSTVFDTVARLTALTSDGTAELTWDTVDGSSREVLWFAVGEAAVPAPPVPVPEHTSLVIRRLRRTPHVTEAMRRLFWKRLQVDFEPGIGNTNDPGADPQAMLRWSNDGGDTWSNEHWTSVGTIGHFYTRAQWYLLGSARDRVLELVVSDPNISWAILDAFADVETGMS